jgi:hypothetical protein
VPHNADAVAAQTCDVSEVTLAYAAVSNSRQGTDWVDPDLAGRKNAILSFSLAYIFAA